MNGFDRQLDKLAASSEISPDDVDFGFKYPPHVRQVLGNVFTYFCRVESEVAKNTQQIKHLFPSLREHTQTFLSIWQRQEIRHGEVFGRLLETLDLPQPALDLNPLTTPVRIGRQLSKVPGLESVLTMNYLVRGALHERLTASGYRSMRNVLVNLGEGGFVDTAINPIMQQEAGHLGYYTRAAAELKGQLTPWQLYAARLLTEKTYAPVGVGTPEQSAAFGKVALTLTGGQLDTFGEPLQNLASKLLCSEEKGLTLPGFVHTALRSSVEAASAGEL